MYQKVAMFKEFNDTEGAGHSQERCVQKGSVTQAWFGFDTRAIEMPHSRDMTCSIASVDCREVGLTHVELCPKLLYQEHYIIAHTLHILNIRTVHPKHSITWIRCIVGIYCIYKCKWGDTAILDTFQVVGIQKLHSLLDKDLGFLSGT